LEDAETVRSQDEYIDFVLGEFPRLDDLRFESAQSQIEVLNAELVRFRTQRDPVRTELVAYLHEAGWRRERHRHEQTLNICYRHQAKTRATAFHVEKLLAVAHEEALPEAFVLVGRR